MQIFLHFFTERNRNSVITEEPQTIRMVYAYILRHTLYVEGEGFLVIKPECLTRQTVKKYKSQHMCCGTRTYLRREPTSEMEWKVKGRAEVRKIQKL